jgi:twitching motility protein PilU
MEYGIAFAETGHLALATLHANNSNQAMDRIINFFPADRRQQLLMDLSLNLKAVISQRLIPKKGGGRVAAVEIMIGTPLISDLILKGEVHELKPIMAKSRDLGMQTFDQALFDLYANGQIEYDTALHYADSSNDLRLMIKLARLEEGDNDKSGELSIM